jgi:hypothetical protein
MSKWILIFVEDNDISEPMTFDTYEEAYKEMEHEFNITRDIDDDSAIHEDYASVQGCCNSWDWRIYEVKF